MEGQNLTTKKKKKWLLPTIVAVIVVVVAISVIAIYNLPTNRRDRQLALAEKYMSELNYEAAILAYKAAIEIDPKCEDAYIELVDLYIAMEAYDEAEEVIKLAENNLNDEIVLSMKEKTNTLLASNNLTTDNSKNTNWEENGNTTEKTTEYKSYLIYRQATSYDSEGNITLIKKEEYDAEGNIIKTIFYNAEGTEYSSNEYQYDKNKNLIMSASYDENKNLTSKKEYDFNGNQLIDISYDENGNMERHIENTYDENSNQIKSISYFSDGSIKYQCEYNANGTVIASVTYDEDGSITSQRTCEYENDGSIHISDFEKNYETNSLYITKEDFYDSEWKLLKEINYGEFGGIIYQTVYEYDGQNLITEISDDDITVYKTEYQYNDNGTVMAEIIYSSDDGEAFIEFNKQLYFYDESGNKIMDELYFDGDLSCRYTYDKNGNELSYDSYPNGVSRVSQYDEHGNIVYHRSEYNIEYEWSYEYDQSGNIISMQEYIDHGNGSYLNQEYKHEYNEYGKEIKFTAYYNNPDLDKEVDHTRVYEYEYDDKGNLSKETCYYRDSSLDSWTEYKYTYN